MGLPLANAQSWLAKRSGDLNEIESNFIALSRKSAQQRRLRLSARRLAARDGHFMPAALLDSQFAILEEPRDDEHPIVVSIAHILARSSPLL